MFPGLDGTGLTHKFENGVSIIHEEHSTIKLPPGNFEIVQQKEYSPEEIRNVAD